jgi:hypothetical protein
MGDRLQWHRAPDTPPPIIAHVIPHVIPHVGAVWPYARSTVRFDTA